MTQRESRRRGLGAAFTAAVLGVSLAALPSTAYAAPAPPAEAEDLLGKQDQALLDQAIQAGSDTVTVLTVAKKGQAESSVEDLTEAGATVEYRADELGYTRVEVPTGKVAEIAKLSSLAGLEIDRMFDLGEPKPAGMDDPDPQPAPGTDTPKVNPYMPTGETGAAQFVEQNPKFDGRGTTVAVLDTGIDIGHPSLATTTTGERKIVDWITATDPDAGIDPTWIDMSSPAPGQPAQFRYGVLNERDTRLAGEVGNDVNRDGNPAGSNGTFGVLWDTATNTVWVDTNQNKTFADDKAMTDYKVKADQNEFGADNPATPLRESIPFTVQIDPVKEAVNIGIVSGQHGSHVAGIVAGNSLFGGAMSGAAPGAKLVSIRVCLWVGGCNQAAMIEGMRFAARSGVDVINMSVGGLDTVNDGQAFIETVYNGLVDEYGVQIFVSAGNDGPGANAIGRPSNAAKVMSVGSYISKASWQRNYGSDVSQEDNLHTFSGRGPTEAGGFKPDILAPGSAISTTPTWQAGGPVVGTYALPPGYTMLQGTSMASPQAAGATALLVSAAVQKNVSHKPEQLRQALKSSARFLKNYQAYEQGNGLIDVKKAWNLLKADIRTTSISSAVPVHTMLSANIRPTPGIGTGIYDREGVKSGDRYVREYTFKRTSGVSSPQTYQVNWVGNDGTFSSPPTITLPLNSAVKFRVTVNPRSSGIHSAVLNLDSPLTTGIEYQTMNTVIAAEDFTAANGYQVKHGGEVGRNDWDSYFVRVPANASALKVDLQGGGTTAGAGQIRFLRFHPFGVPIESSTNSLSCYNPPVPGGSCNGTQSPTSRTWTTQLPGVWEIVVDARRTSDTARAPYTLTMSVLSTTVAPNPDTIPSAQLNQPVQRQYTLSNKLGVFNGRAVGTDLGSAKTDRPSITKGVTHEYFIEVAPGSTQLRAKTGNTSDTAADLDLYLERCPNGPTRVCTAVVQSADEDAEEAVSVANPAAGFWKVRVVGFEVPAGTTTYDYLDVFTNALFGNLAIADPNTDRATGATWTVSGVLTAKTAPPAGRILVGSVEARTVDNALVGSGDVIVQALS
jgi:subtilisin family serine protease